MKEENSEEWVITKKKNKKGKIFSPEFQNCSAENGTQVKLKKEKKWKKDKSLAKEDKEEFNQKDKKKKKRHDSVFITEVEDNKRKKKLLEDVNQAENSTLKDEQLEKTKRKKKLKDKPVQIQTENVKKEEVEEMPIGNNNPPKKPKKKKGTVLVSSPAETEEVVGEKTKKKKKALVITDVVVEIKTEQKAKVVENLMNVEKGETQVEVKLKKKKESKSERLGKDLEESEIQKRKKRMTEDEEILHKKKEKFIKEDTGIEEGKSKKKKIKKEKEENCRADADEVASKKRKKVKVEEDEEEVWSQEHSIPLDADSQNKKSKKNRKSEKGDLDNITEAKAWRKKKRKVKEQGDTQEVSQGDVLFLSAKNGNTDEGSINQERRKALQMEIDKASQPHQPDKPTALGQWSTAQFDNSQQQQKFLRLMGGFKKGFQVAEKTAGGANMALGKNAQQQLQQGLLGEFERAQMRKMDFSNRGAGLGFTAPSNKKFTINVNASRSVRFDD